jgi:hypothetical protein
MVRDADGTNIQRPRQDAADGVWRLGQYEGGVSIP